ncbi:unnamed protein product [Adineta steineri]|uniref:NADAR domain-containing protein n=1 Tax=Adineta steineri TaxID=433720 RepID=A0A815M756_9BILA|nr:unnamed protein product [Adineta steineri]CAF1419055.1 unnamed protein product [Adineta steineri]CAF3864012.1 unnamed protein product [Adineta steineri]
MSHHHHHSSSPIHFYDLNGLFGEFGNFYSAPIKLDGLTWPTVEHYFQAQKFSYDKHRVKHVSQLPSPRDAFDYAHDHNSSLRWDWMEVRDKVMFKACMAKFQQHPHLQHMLLSTGQRTLVEHTEKDSYWADGGDGSGQNKLGITLMKVREAIKDHQHHHH